MVATARRASFLEANMMLVFLAWCVVVVLVLCAAEQIAE
jgi:hypothetical protein